MPDSPDLWRDPWELVQEAVSVLDNGYGHADAPYHPDVLTALALLRQAVSDETGKERSRARLCGFMHSRLNRIKNECDSLQHDLEALSHSPVSTAGGSGASA